MGKRKFEIHIKIKDKRTGKYDSVTERMPKKEIIEAESEANAITKLRDSLAYKLASTSGREWEVVKVRAM